MRKFKFRAWDIKNEKMIEDFLNFAGWEALKTMTNPWHQDDKYIIEQWTGFQDKNGKDIYEGDIITGDYHNMDVDYSKTGTVQWGETYDSDGWMCGRTSGWVLSNGSSLADVIEGCYNNASEKTEIVGNIHEDKA